MRIYRKNERLIEGIFFNGTNLDEIVELVFRRCGAIESIKANSLMVFLPEKPNAISSVSAIIIKQGALGSNFERSYVLNQNNWIVVEHLCPAIYEPSEFRERYSEEISWRQETR